MSMRTACQPWSVSPAARLAPWLLMAVALALRLYRLPDYTVFQGDQGVDALAARRLVAEHVWPLEGPATSAGGVHLGPLYYYLLALPMLLGSFDPVYQAALVAVLGAASVGLLYWIALDWFGFWPAVMGAALFAVAPAAIVASRSAWNPAPAPFFLLLALLGLARCHHTCDGRWLLLTGIGVGALIQFHYFTLGVVLVCIGCVVYEAFRVGRRGVAWGVLSLALFAALLTPLVLHELRDGFPNVQAARALAVEAPAQLSESAPRRLYEVLALGLVGGFLSAGTEALAVLLSLMLLVGLAVRRGFAEVLITLTLVVSALQALAYRGPIFEHYFVPLAPLAFLALSALLAAVPLSVGVPAAVLLVGLNLWLSPLRSEPAYQLARTEATASAISDRANREPFAIWLMGDDDKDGAYRYQLARFGDAPVAPDEPLPKRLFVICQEAQCDPQDLHRHAGPDWSSSTPTWQSTQRGVTLVELEQPAAPRLNS